MPNSLDCPGPPSSTRVVVAMSGGVDSSVVAAMLTRDGYDVVGVTLRLYGSATSESAAPRKGACCAGADIHDARRVAERLGIPHYVLDYEDRFRSAVIDRFADSYAAGETPIPCVECNRMVKFTDLLDAARDLGAACLATGHYVESRPGPAGPSGPAGRTLHRAADPARDQSYFLYATTQEQLDFLRFPLGTLTKAQTRQLARELGVPVSEKPDSQDICFVPGGRYADIVRRLRPDAARAGDIVHVDGRVLGRHEGVIGFTVGQRRGIGIAAAEPLYVVAVEAASARVVVGPREALAVETVAVRDMNWLGAPLDEAANRDLRVWARLRSTRPPQPARLRAGPHGVSVELDEPGEGVAPGQACVLYDGDGAGARMLGGGTVARTRAAFPIRRAA